MATPGAARIDHATGEIMCLVQEPAVYSTGIKRMLKHPATTRTMQIPGEYKTVVFFTADTGRRTEGLLDRLALSLPPPRKRRNRSRPRGCRWLCCPFPR
jgi:hypothetical protein